MKPKDRAIEALERRKPSPGLVPTFELEYQLTPERFGKQFYFRKDFETESRPEHRRRMYDHNVDLYLAIARAYDWSIIMPSHGYYGEPNLEEVIWFLERLQEKGADRYLVMLHGEATMSIPNGDNMMGLACQLADRPREIKDRYAREVRTMLERTERLKGHGVDGFVECCDYCFNDGPFLSPRMFAEFVTPYLTNLMGGYRRQGYYTVKHTDGDIMPILDQLAASGPHALHSLDPMAGVDIAEVKRRVGRQVCLIGNVNCALMQTGTDEEVRASAEYALKSGMPEGGYIYSTSNVAFAGLPLSRYELIMQVRQEKGRYE